GGNESHMVFRRVFQPRQVQKKRPLQPITLCNPGPGRFARTGEEPLVFKPVMDHSDSAPGQPEKRHDIASSVLADSDDFILASGEPFNHQASIKHPFPVVLPGNMKWSKIMDRGN